MALILTNLKGKKYYLDIIPKTYIQNLVDEWENAGEGEDYKDSDYYYLSITEGFSSLLL